jgi:hypothetical protein
MMLGQYHAVWAVDFEFIAHPGSRPVPVCLVAHELHSRRAVRLWQNQFGPTPPYSVDAGSLFIAFYASAELSCHRALDWPMPERILDLFLTIRRQRPQGPALAQQPDGSEPDLELTGRYAGQWRCVAYSADVLDRGRHRRVRGQRAKRHSLSQCQRAELDLGGAERSARWRVQPAADADLVERGRDWGFHRHTAAVA